MVHKFVFVPGAEPHVSPVERVPTRGGSSGALGIRHPIPSKLAMHMQWLLLGIAIGVSAVAFSVAKAKSEHQATAAVDR